MVGRSRGGETRVPHGGGGGRPGVGERRERGRWQLQRQTVFVQHGSQLLLLTTTHARCRLEKYFPKPQDNNTCVKTKTTKVSGVLFHNRSLAH